MALPAFTYLPMRVMPYARHTAALTFFYRFAIIFRLSPKGVQRRAIAQLVSVQVWGTWGRRFKSGLPDIFFLTFVFISFLKSISDKRRLMMVGVFKKVPNAFTLVLRESSIEQAN